MKRAILFYVLVCWVFTVNSQVNPSYYSNSGQLVKVDASGIANGNKIIVSSTYKSGSVNLRESNKSAKLSLKLDLGPDFVMPDISPNTFLLQVEVHVQFSSATYTSAVMVRTLAVTNEKPEMLRIDDVMADITTNPSFTCDLVSVFKSAGTALGLLDKYVTDNARLIATIEREFAVDVRTSSNGIMTSAPLVQPVVVNGRLVTFDWSTNGTSPYPNYEVQVLKLYNKDATQTNPNILVSDADWSRALSIETQSFRQDITLNIAEGSGFYLWRVRPIGTFYEGGWGNSENYGEWSYSGSTTSTMSLSKSTLLGNNPTPYAFYFTDPDEQLNWIYSRVFTEGDEYDKSNPTGIKSSEGMTYADGLQRVRQSQKFNSSENTNIVSQTISDFSGRPALTTMPVPTSGNLSGYKNDFVMEPGNTNPYSAESFDSDAKLTTPDQVESGGTSAFKYYSGATTSSPSNKDVASAGGYPYKRTVYYPDGSGRVAEESGFGARHSIGLQTNGKGRTTRYYYTTPSEDELIRVFGDEAPKAESVIKTITTDQNNVESVTYTSKEGKTIATALKSNQTNNLDPLFLASNTFTVGNSINEKIAAVGKMVSSKRIAVTADNTTLTLSYAVGGLPTIPGCPGGECNFKMRLFIADLQKNVVYVSNADPTQGKAVPLNVQTNPFADGWRFELADSYTNTTGAPSVISTTVIAPSTDDKIELDKGEYVFIKEVYSANAPNYADMQVNVENDKMMPILEVIANRLKGIGSPEEYDTYVAWMAHLKTLFDAYDGSQGKSDEIMDSLQLDPAELPQGYMIPQDFTLSAISPMSGDPMNSGFSVSTGCCGNISASLPIRPICILCDGSPESQYQGSHPFSVLIQANNNAPTNSITPYGLNDFVASPDWTNPSTTEAQKRDAVYTLVERELTKLLWDKMNNQGFNPNGDLWKVAPGFSWESLKFMLANMLISQYYTGSAFQNTTTSTWHAGEVLSNGNYSLSLNNLALSDPSYPFNYNCKDLYGAWLTAVESFNSFETGPGNSVLQDYNTEEGNGAAQDNADDDENWEDLSKRQKKKLKKKLSQEMDDFDNSDDGKFKKSRQEASTNVIAAFMGFAGYQFAAIIDGNPLPSYVSSLSTEFPDDYFHTFTVSANDAPSGPSIYTNLTMGSGSFTNSPLLFEVVTGQASLTTNNCNSSTAYELYYPYMAKPEWMFKYFTYNLYENNNGGFIDDYDVLFPHQIAIDQARLYNAPLSYVASSVSPVPTLCNTPPAQTYQYNGNSYTMPGYYHLNWKTTERVDFYMNIRGAPRCYKSKGVDIPSNGPPEYYDSNLGLPECETKTVLVTNAISQLDTRIADCYKLKNEIRQALEFELLSACYNIVDCKVNCNDVTEKELDLMVTKVIQTATLELSLIKNKFLSLVDYSLSPCSPTVATSYGNDLCQLPSCYQTNCDELILLEDNSIMITASRKTVTKYFADCDQKIIDMIAYGAFLPHIQAATCASTCPNPPCVTGCNHPDKEWMDNDCIQSMSCGTPQTISNKQYNVYEEHTGCNGTDPQAYEKYSKTYSVQAGQ
jgi:hypothetical protein